MRTRSVLTMEDAKTMAFAAEREAKKNGWPVTIAVCDEGGHLLWLQRLDGAHAMSAELAPAKARACVLAKKPGKALEDMVNKGRFAALSMPIVPLEGGEMVLADGELMGAVGVSGALAAQDAQVARAGVAAIGANWE